VKEAWYNFGLDFFKCVSLKSEHLLNDVDGTNTFPINKCITLSSEAILTWFIKCKYKLISNAAQTGFPQNGVSDHRKSGPPDSSSKLGLFVSFYKDAKEGCDNKRSMSIGKPCFGEIFTKKETINHLPKRAVAAMRQLKFPLMTDVCQCHWRRYTIIFLSG
jgi:hypothetical protein